MPLASAGGGANLTWQLFVNNAGYTQTLQGPDTTQSFSLSGINTTTWNQLFAEEFLLNATTHTDIDLTNFTNLVNEAVNMTAVLGIMVLPIGVSCTVGPGPTNGLQWFWSGPNTNTTVTSGGTFFWCDNPSLNGTAVNSTSKILRLSNPNGVGQCSVTIEVLGKQ